MSDRYERECEEKENIKEIIKNEKLIAKALRDLYPHVKSYRKYSHDLQKAGYKIEETENDIKIWKEI